MGQDMDQDRTTTTAGPGPGQQAKDHMPDPESDICLVCLLLCLLITHQSCSARSVSQSVNQCS